MSPGTKSLLFGVHQVALHPWFVAAAWWQLYGFPWDPRLWVAFLVHDWGYWGKADLDGREGTFHPELGAKIMGRLFGRTWHDFALLHSRYYSKLLDRPYSRLCVADKLVVVLMPWWLYVPLARLSGELSEYMTGQGGRTPAKDPCSWAGQRAWLREVHKYLRGWVSAHRDGGADTWTPAPGSLP